MITSGCYELREKKKKNNNFLSRINHNCWYRGGVVNFISLLRKMRSNISLVIELGRLFELIV